MATTKQVPSQSPTSLEDEKHVHDISEDTYVSHMFANAASATG